jgi:prepilin-type N-terminal cleavage/methylation domain-containing protein
MSEMEDFKMASRKKAFTLVELLAVIAIIGILAGFIFAAVSSSIERAKITKTQGTINSLDVALTNYERDIGSFEAKLENGEQMPTGYIQPNADDKRVQIIRLLTGKELVKKDNSYVFRMVAPIFQDPKWNGPYLDPKMDQLVSKDNRFAPGQLLDAWGNPIMIRIKRGNFDDRMSYRPDSFETYSWGPNEENESGKADDVNNWD